MQGYQTISIDDKNKESRKKIEEKKYQNIIYPLPGSFGRPKLDNPYASYLLKNYETKSQDAEVTKEAIEKNIGNIKYFHEQR